MVTRRRERRSYTPSLYFNKLNQLEKLRKKRLKRTIERTVKPNTVTKGTVDQENVPISRIRNTKFQFEDIALEKVKWKSLIVGDIVRINKNQQIPADLLLLSSSDEKGRSYVETKNLDGETNLKPKIIASPLVKFRRSLGNKLTTNPLLSDEENEENSQQQGTRRDSVSINHSQQEEDNEEFNIWSSDIQVEKFSTSRITVSFFYLIEFKPQNTQDHIIFLKL